MRTIQRIEKGESIPKGDTLIKITHALGVTPDDVLEWAEIEDRGYLTILNLSAISLIIHPLLGIIIPLVMWILKKEKIKFVDDSGKKIINFQITWVLTLYVVLIGGSNEAYIPFNFNILKAFPHLFYNFSIIGLIISMLYCFNLLLVIMNIRRSQRGLKNIYLPAIPILI